MTKRYAAWWCTIALVLGALVGPTAAHAEEVAGPGAVGTVEAVDDPACVDGFRAQFTQTHAYGRQFGASVRVAECASGAPADGTVRLALSGSGEVIAESRLSSGSRSFAGVSAPRSESSFDIIVVFEPVDGSPSRSWPARVTTASSSVSLRMSTDVKAGGVTNVDATVVTPRTLNIGGLVTPNKATGTVVVRRGDAIVGTAELTPSSVYVNESWARLRVSGLAIGEPVVLDYLGDAGYPAGTSSKPLLDNRTRTETAITSATVSATHAQVVAEIVDWSPGSSQWLLGEPVAISVDGRLLGHVVAPANELGRTETEHGLRSRLRVVKNFEIAPGTHDITVSFGGTDQLQPSSASTTLTVAKVPTSVSKPHAVPATVRSTSPTVLRSTVLDSTGAPINVRVAFQERAVGSTTWRTVVTTTTKNGVAALSTTPRVSRDYRAVVQGTSTYTGSTSQTSRVTVSRTASLARIQHPTAPRTSAILVTKVAPVGKVLLQERLTNGTWVTRVTRTAAGSAGSTSEVRFLVGRTTANRVFRVLAPSDQAATQAISPTVTVPKR